MKTRRIKLPDVAPDAHFYMMQSHDGTQIIGFYYIPPEGKWRWHTATEQGECETEGRAISIIQKRAKSWQENLRERVELEIAVLPSPENDSAYVVRAVLDRALSSR